nr:three component ABC system middle component [Bradyrhizobium sp. 143]
MPFTLEGLGLLMHCDAVMVSPDGRLVPNSAGVRKTINGSDESKACPRVAAFMGKEFARIAERGTIYTTLGVRP